MFCPKAHTQRYGKCMGTLTWKFWGIPSSSASAELRRCVLWEWCPTFRRKLSVLIYKGWRFLGFSPKRRHAITYPRSVTTYKKANSDLSIVNIWLLDRITWSVSLYLHVCSPQSNTQAASFTTSSRNSQYKIHAIQTKVGAVWHVKMKAGWSHRTRSLFSISREDLS